MAKPENPFEALPEGLRNDPVLDEYRQNFLDDASQSQRALNSYFYFNLLFIVSALVASISSGLLLYGTDPTAAGVTLPDVIQTDPPTTNQNGEGQTIDPVVTEWVGKPTLTVILAILAIAGALGSSFSAFMLSARDLERRWVLNHVGSTGYLLKGFRASLERAHDQAPDIFQEAVRCYVEKIARGRQKYYESERRRAGIHLTRLAIFGASVAGLGAITGLVTFVPGVGAAAVAAIIGILTPAMSASARSWANAAPNPNAEERFEAASRSISDAIVSHIDDLESSEVTLDQALAFADEVETAVNAELERFRTRVEE